MIACSTLLTLQPVQNNWQCNSAQRHQRGASCNRIRLKTCMMLKGGHVGLMRGQAHTLTCMLRLLLLLVLNTPLRVIEREHDDRSAIFVCLNASILL